MHPESRNNFSELFQQGLIAAQAKDLAAVLTRFPNLTRDRSCRITNHSRSRLHTFCHDGPHPDYRTTPDDNRLVSAILDYHSGANIRMVFYNNVSIAHYARSKGHEITNDAIMCNVGINVSMKEAANLRVRSNMREAAENCTIADDVPLQ
jgi:hypothetical protein